MNIQLNLQSNRVKTGSTSNRMQMTMSAVNRKSLREAQSGKRKDGQDRREDRVQISQSNQMQGRLDFLMERKQELIERKNEVMASGDWDSVKAMVAMLEEQISNVETEISQTMKEMIEEQLEKAEEEKKNGKDPETKEEQQMQYLNNLSNASMDYKQVSQVHKAHDKKEGEARVLSKEVELDDSRPGGASKGKREHLGEVLDEADQLYKKAMKGYAKINASLDDMEEENVEEKKKLNSEEEQEKAAAHIQEVVDELLGQEQEPLEETKRDELQRVEI